MTQDKEKPVPAQPQTHELQTTPRVSLQDVRNLVIERPGIKRADAIEALVFADRSNAKKISDLISYMLNDKQLRQVDEAGSKCLHPGPRINEVRSGKKTGKPKAEVQKRPPHVRSPTRRLCCNKWTHFR